MGDKLPKMTSWSTDAQGDEESNQPYFFYKTLDDSQGIPHIKNFSQQNLYWVPQERQVLKGCVELLAESEFRAFVSCSSWSSCQSTLTVVRILRLFFFV